MLKSLAHACFVVADLDRTERFYCAGLGMSLAFEFLAEDGSRRGFYLACGGRTFLEFFRGQPEPINEKASYRHISLEVDDLDAAVDRLAAIGVQATGRKLGNDRSWQAWTADPDGNKIELHCYTPQSRQTLAMAAAAQNP